MNQISLSYKQYILKFKNPFKTSGTEINERKGFLITFKENNFRGIGDAAPFPEFGSETFEDAQKGLSDFKLNLRLNLSDFRDSLKENLKSIEHLPALRHGIEQGFLNFISNKCNISLNELLNYESVKTVNVNGIIGLVSPEKAAIIASKLTEEGYSTIKIKVGREEFIDDLNTVKKIRSILPKNIKLRIDANGKWDLKSAIENLKEMEAFDIEYCEQPVKNISYFPKLKKETIIPLAADESIRNYKNAKKIITKKAAAYLILKPMMIGGIIPTMEIAELAAKNKINVVITSSFESPVGKSFALLAASFLKNNFAHGLGTVDYFESDLIDPYPVYNGTIRLG